MIEIKEGTGKLLCFADGACFGWHDLEFEECGNCGIAAACAKATASPEVEAIRAIPKRDEAEIRRLAAEWDAKPAPKQEPAEASAPEAAP